MAKYLENENESPEVDLKNLTVKLAGMGLDEEIEDVIPGKKEKKSKKDSDKEDSSDKEENKPEEETVEEKESEEETDTEESESEDISEEEKEFFEKRAAERDLTLEKVEALEEEMESSDDKAQKLGALDTIVKKTEKPKIIKEKKKGKLDGIAIAGIIVAILALIGGVFYIYKSVHQEPNLGITERQFRVNYYESPIYSNICYLGFNIPEPTYHEDKEKAAATNTNEDGTPVTTESTAAKAVDPTAVTTEEKSRYRYFEAMIKNDYEVLPIFVVGSECRSNNYLKTMRFFAVADTQDEYDWLNVNFAAFLQSFYVGTDSQVCLDKVKNAYNQSVQSAEIGVPVKDGDLAYVVTHANIDGVPCYVMDIMPAKEADDYVFVNSLGEN
ncbi:MAG: hypothetical protein J5653_07180 [Clostridiales bacterium]|nr:hypothetical protein [Clostridiales bacterium]